MEHLKKLSPLFTAGIFLFAFLGGIFIIVDNKIEPLKVNQARFEANLVRLEANQARFEQKVEGEFKEIRSLLFQLLQKHSGP